MKKREWIYIQSPTEYEIVCDRCGGTNIAWSEFKHMIWCWSCNIDTGGTEGVFGGPIPINALGLIGLTLDRIHIKTGKRMKMINMGNRLEYMLCIY